MAANMKIPEKEKTKLARYIKAKIAEQGQTIRGVVRQMNEMFPDRTEYDPGTINQINAGNMPYWKVVRFAAALGYEIQWVKKKEDGDDE